MLSWDSGKDHGRMHGMAGEAASRNRCDQSSTLRSCLLAWEPHGLFHLQTFIMSLLDTPHKLVSMAAEKVEELGQRWAEGLYWVGGKGQVHVQEANTVGRL